MSREIILGDKVFDWTAFNKPLALINTDDVLNAGDKYSHCHLYQNDRRHGYHTNQSPHKSIAYYQNLIFAAI